MNTNRISTDIKHAKEALEKKLDSLQTGMDGIPNLLTPSFDSIKNVLSTITTKVDNVRGGVDLNHTALTDLQNRLTAVEGSVGKVQQDVGKVQGAMGKLSPLNNLNVKRTANYSSGNAVFVQVNGKGNLYFATLFKGICACNSCAAEVYVDGVKTFNFCGGSREYWQQEYSGFFSSPVLKGFPNASQGGGSYDYFINVATTAGLFGVCTIGLYADNFEYYSKPNSNKVSNKIYTHEKPIAFKSSLKVQVTNGSGFGIAVAYTLE